MRTKTYTSEHYYINSRGTTYHLGSSSIKPIVLIDDFHLTSLTPEEASGLFDRIKDLVEKTNFHEVSYNEKKNTLTIVQKEYDREADEIKEYRAYYHFIPIRKEENQNTFEVLRDSYLNRSLDEAEKACFIDQIQRFKIEQEIEGINEPFIKRKTLEETLALQQEKQSMIDELEMNEYEYLVIHIKEGRREKMASIIAKMLCHSPWIVPLLTLIISTFLGDYLIPLLSFLALIIGALSMVIVYEIELPSKVKSGLYHLMNKCFPLKKEKKKHHIKTLSKKGIYAPSLTEEEKKLKADILLQKIYEEIVELEEEPYPKCHIEAVKLQQLAHKRAKWLKKHPDKRDILLENDPFGKQLEEITTTMKTKKDYYEREIGDTFTLDRIDEMVSSPHLDVALPTDNKGNASYQKKIF